MYVYVRDLQFGFTSKIIMHIFKLQGCGISHRKGLNPLKVSGQRDLNQFVLQCSLYVSQTEGGYNLGENMLCACVYVVRLCVHLSVWMSETVARASTKTSVEARDNKQAGRRNPSSATRQIYLSRMIHTIKHGTWMVQEIGARKIMPEREKILRGDRQLYTYHIVSIFFSVLVRRDLGCIFSISFILIHLGMELTNKFVLAWVKIIIGRIGRAHGEWIYYIVLTPSYWHTHGEARAEHATKL